MSPVDSPSPHHASGHGAHPPPNDLPPNPKDKPPPPPENKLWWKLPPADHKARPHPPVPPPGVGSGGGAEAPSHSDSLTLSYTSGTATTTTTQTVPYPGSGSSTSSKILTTPSHANSTSSSPTSTSAAPGGTREPASVSLPEITPTQQPNGHPNSGVDTGIIMAIATCTILLFVIAVLLCVRTYAIRRRRRLTNTTQAWASRRLWMSAANVAREPHGPTSTTGWDFGTESSLSMRQSLNDFASTSGRSTTVSNTSASAVPSTWGAFGLSRPQSSLSSWDSSRTSTSDASSR